MSVEIELELLEPSTMSTAAVVEALSDRDRVSAGSMTSFANDAVVDVESVKITKFLFKIRSSSY